MKKAALLEQLHRHTYVTIKPSPVQGIGVFALVKISKGQRGIFSSDTSEWIAVSKEEVAALPAHSRHLVENFCLYDEGCYFIPEYGFKLMDLVVYLNHSENPNVISLEDGADFEALRDIEPGEELFVDYGSIVHSEE